jgi:L-alanine-DL-glutamate epimerase-like enolase superfamily enzyme
MFPGQKVARAAAEMALLDALSRLDDVPVHQRLSGISRARPGLVTDITLPILTPERMAELAQQWWKLGFRAFKVKVGKDLDADLRAFEAIVKVVPGATFRPDANAGFSASQALKLAAEMERLGAHLECFEQPCGRDDMEGMAEVARALHAPVIADESVRSLEDARRVIAAKAGDGINLKIVKSGGLRSAHAIGALARQSGLSLMVGGMVETRLGMTAAAHLSASLGGAEFPDLDTAWLLKTDPFDGGYESEGPRYTLPDAPGLGVSKKSGVSHAVGRRQ